MPMYYVFFPVSIGFPSEETFNIFFEFQEFRKRLGISHEIRSQGEHKMAGAGGCIYNASMSPFNRFWAKFSNYFCTPVI